MYKGGIKIDIRERLKVETKGHSIYNVRRDEYKGVDSYNINFRVTPTPFKLTKILMQELELRLIMHTWEEIREN